MAVASEAAGTGRAVWFPLKLEGPGMAIVRWTTTNPRGDDEHYGLVHYGTDPEKLDQAARGHIRLNRAHPETMFRARLERLQPQTTYYCKVSSMGGDGVEGPLSHFTTPAPGEVIYTSQSK
jgi:Purple acid Phosphatase, N-terminal domain